MLSLLRELKTILAHEQAVCGPIVPLDARAAMPASPQPETVTRMTDAVETGVQKKETPDCAASSDLATNPAEPSNHSDNKLTMPNHDLFGTPLTQATDHAPVRRPQSPYERIHALISAESPLCRMTGLDEVEAYVRNTILIPLDRVRTNPVFGVGNPHADLMVIGEAPGADEDAQGEPFVGRAGQLLDKILAAIEFERKEVYIANILKSRPPNNRDPLPAEVDAHLPVLHKQIALIQPKLILCVGKTSATTLLNQQTTLGALRQKFHDFHGLPLLVTYHPAALLRNPQWKRPTWDDVQLLRRRYDELVGIAA